MEGARCLIVAHSGNDHGGSKSKDLLSREMLVFIKNIMGACQKRNQDKNSAKIRVTSSC